MLPFFHRDHLFITIGAFLLFFLLYLVTFNISFLNPVAEALKSFSMSDIMFDIEQASSETKVNNEITVVDISNVSKREEIALVLERIYAGNPACIGVDVIFEGYKDNTSGDNSLRECASLIKDKTVFATKLTDYSSEGDFFSNRACSFFEDSVRIEKGYVNLMNSLDNSPVRKLSITRKCNADTLSSFPLLCAERYAGKKLKPGKKELLINYRNIEFPVVPADAIEENLELIEGRIVLVGTIHEERDMHVSPIGKLPGVLIQAHSVNTLMAGDLKTIPEWVGWIIAFMLCYLFQFSLEWTIRAASSKQKSFHAIFAHESGYPGGIIFVIWSFILCYIFYLLFSFFSICIEGGLLLALLALTIMSRNYYRATILGLQSKYGKSFTFRSIYLK